MNKTFDELLADFLAEHKDVPLSEQISALELQLYALKEQEGEEE